MQRSRLRPATLVLLLAWLPGCRSYEPRPLDPSAVIAAVERTRLGAGDEGAGTTDPAPERSGGVTFDEAAAWMRRLGPEIREAVAAYRTAVARANVPTPLPNPSLEVGPEYGFGDAVTTNRVVPFGSLGVTIPLGPRLERTDDLNRVLAEVARVDALARHRELYMELRRRWVRLVGLRAAHASREELVLSADRSVESAVRLVDAGQATALDVALFELEKGRSRAEQLAAEADAAEAAAALAALVGVHAGRFRRTSVAGLPDAPEEPPDLRDLKQRMLRHHAGLARLRARYEESEARLRLEVARQYPDLRLGPSIAGETGDEKTVLGLALGFALPLFDRNEQAIAEAEQRREEARVRYEAEANRALAELERARQAVGIARRRLETLRGTVLVEATSSIRLARESLSAGSGDALRLLDAERSHREVLLEVELAALAELEAWVDLELAVGCPLLRFPSESAGAVGVPPDGLDAGGERRPDGAGTGENR